ncbi:interleukin-1 receptor-associated kinase 1-binding protein 1 homolog [Salminus brasiliensis]|uniref:interleukin-1 receptor-associated kinase 1-binding protein 1 homolog n=1 Tax=Salminus brasiliensis TaxID=930266 RepID=UPI003B839667
MAVSPARVFASLIPASGGLRGEMDELELNYTTKPRSPPPRVPTRRVEVTGSAELRSPPDRAALTVSVTSSKESVNDAANSVTRRLDYILQTLRQRGVKEGDTVVTKHTQRDDDLYRMQAEVSVVFSDFEKMQCVRSLLIEKLDRSVCVGDPQFSHSEECLSLLRRRVCVAAVETARLKAIEVCSVLGQGLGRPLLVREEDFQEWTCGQQGGVVNPTLTLQQKVGQMTVCASSRVFVTFELRPKDSTRKKL